MTISAVCATTTRFPPSRSTGKERDNESGNDYFGARYYASSMGRFMSPDWSAKIMPVPYAKLDNPQSLNLYSYVWNNPLSRNDPTGHYNASCGGDVKECDKQIKNLNNSIKTALQSKDPSVVAAARAYGTLGEDNGVNVSIVKTVDPSNSNVLGKTTAQAGTGGMQVDTSGTLKQATQVTIKAGLSGNQLEETAVHEGVHVEDRGGYVATLNALQDSSGKLSTAMNITHTQSEINAYGVQNTLRQSLGEPALDVKDILSKPPYSTEPGMSQPLFPDMPSKQ